MKRYWLSDCHFGHPNIIKYCNRPTLKKADLDINGKWVSPEIALAAADRHDKFLIRNINGRIKPDDNVVHVGDFMNRGGAAGVQGFRNGPDYYINQLNGRWVMIEGNHDTQNKVKSVARYMIVDIGPYTAFVSHYPLENFHRFKPELIEYVVNCTDFQITAHVHNAWTYKYHSHNNKPYLMYNVGIDVHRYVPIHDAEIICDVDKLLKV